MMRTEKKSQNSRCNKDILCIDIISSYPIPEAHTATMPIFFFSHSCRFFFVKPAYNVFFFYHFVNGANNGTWLLVCDAHFTDHHSVGFFALCVLSCHLLYSFFLCAFSRSVVVVELSAVVHCFFFHLKNLLSFPFLLSTSHTYTILDAI